MLHRQKGVSCGPAPNGTVIYELRKKEIPSLGSAVLFHLRDAFRSGDVWLAHSRRYGDLKQVLVPMIAAQENAKLAVLPTHRIGWQTERRDSRSLLSGWPGLPVTALFARSIEDGTLRIDRLTADVRMVPRHSYWICIAECRPFGLPTCCLKLMQPLVSQMRLPI